MCHGIRAATPQTAIGRRSSSLDDFDTEPPWSLGRGDHPKFHAGSRGKGWVVDTIGPVHEDVSDIAWSQQSQCLAFANGNRYRREKAFERVLWAARSPTSARDRTAACRVRADSYRPETTIQGQSVTLTWWTAR